MNAGAAIIRGQPDKRHHDRGSHIREYPDDRICFVDQAILEKHGHDRAPDMPATCQGRQEASMAYSIFGNSHDLL